MKPAHLLRIAFTTSVASVVACTDALDEEYSDPDDVEVINAGPPRTFFVAKDGNDNHTCDEAQRKATPMKTIRSALRCEAAGDIVMIDDGVYEENISNMMAAGISEAQRTTIRAVNRRKAIIRPGSASNALLVGNRPFVALVGVVIDGANVQPGAALKIESGSHFVLLDDIETRNAPSQGILVHKSTHGTLRNSRSHHNGDSKLDHGMYLSKGSDDWHIENNEFDHNAQMGIQLYSQPKRTRFIGNFLHHNCQKPGGGGAELHVAHQDQIVQNNRIWVTGSCTGGINIHLQAPARSRIVNNSVFCAAGLCSVGIGISVGERIAANKATGTVVEGNTVLGFNRSIVDNGIDSVVAGNRTTGDPASVWVSPSTGDLRPR